MTDILGENFKTTILKMLRELQKNVEKVNKMITEQNGDSKEIEIFKKSNPEMKSTITEMENSLEGFKSRFKQAEESVDLKIELWKLLRPRNRKKGLKKCKQSPRGLWNTIKQTNIHIVGIQKEKRE